MKKITSISVISAPEGKRISYTFSELDENGNIVRSNVRESFVALNKELLDVIETLESKISEKMASA